MDNTEFTIIFYDESDGTKPAKDFILGLDPKMMAKMLRVVNMLETNGTELREPYSKHLSEGIFELRAKVGSDITRVLYFFMVGRKAVLTHGFIKKTQKTPTDEIERAKIYRYEYLNREENLQ
jgi:phage-related protein